MSDLRDESAALALIERERVPKTGAAERAADALRSAGMVSVANRIAHLSRAAAEDPEDDPIDPDSLRRLTRFLIEERQLPRPRIGVSPGGIMQIEWRIAGGGILAMEFPPDGRIGFAGVSGNERVSGTLGKDAAMQAVKPFMDKLGDDGDANTTRRCSPTRGLSESGFSGL